MLRTHLTTERLLAIRDGESEDRRELEHLISCPECQAAFDDSRWLALVVKLRRGMRATGPHIGRDEMLAYHMQALPRDRVATIREHLVGCRACLAAYGRSRETSRRNHYSSPSPKALSGVMERFRPRRMRRLGRLLVRALSGGLDLSFEGETPVAGSTFVAEQMTGRGHPSSARRRIQRLAQEDAALESLRVEDSSPMDVSATASGAAPILGLPWGLQVTAVPGAHDLRVTLTPIATERSAGGVDIRIVPDRGTESRSTTDKRGTAVLPCPSGSSRLIVEVDPPLVVQVEHHG